MKLLVLTNNPERPSFRQRIKIYLPLLQRSGIQCGAAKFPSGESARLKIFQLASEFDAVFLHKKTLNFLDMAVLRRYAKKVIYDFDDAVMYSDKHPEKKPSLYKHTKPFKRTIELADLVLAGNGYLAEHAREFNNNVIILPTGLDVDEYQPQKREENDGKIRLVWIGSKSTLGYLKGISPALEQVGKRFGNVVLRIICNEFFDLDNMEVEKYPWSLKSQGADLFTADIGLAPLPDNRFTRGKCGFKALQYAAATLATVSSPVGVNCEYVKNGVTGYHATGQEQWAENIGKLIEDSELRQKMAKQAWENVKEFDIKVIGNKLANIITEFAGKHSIAVGKVEAVDTEPMQISSSSRPKVSVCIPTYNRKGYLRETIDSVLAQTYKDYEIVIVDDGSSDGTGEMVKQLDVPIVYHWQKNGGDAAARNKLIELARGEYISFIDSDDLLIPDAIERMVKATESETEDVVVYGSYYRIDKNGIIYGRCKRKLYSGHITKHLFENILVHSCGSLFPKRILKETSPFDTSLKVCSDYAFWLGLSVGHRFIALDAPTFKRRRHQENLSYFCFENCFTEFKVLEDFYYQKGGEKLIPKATAMKVLSKESRRTGCRAMDDGLYSQARQFLRLSFRQYPNLKSLIYWIRAMNAG